MLLSALYWLSWPINEGGAAASRGAQAPESARDVLEHRRWAPCKSRRSRRWAGHSTRDRRTTSTGSLRLAQERPVDVRPPESLSRRKQGDAPGPSAVA